MAKYLAENGVSGTIDISQTFYINYCDTLSTMTL